MEAKTKKLDATAFKVIMERRAHGFRYDQIIEVLGAMGYGAVRGGPLRAEELSRFAIKNGLRSRAPYTKGRKNKSAGLVVARANEAKKAVSDFITARATVAADPKTHGADVDSVLLEIVSSRALTRTQKINALMALL